MFKNSQIIITKDIQETLNKIQNSIKNRNFLTFNLQSFLIDDAKEVIKESYISSKDNKYIFLASPNFNIFAQNALLKILEEPPKNIIFILITNHKNSLLPTVRSRVPITFWSKKKLDIDIDIDFKKKSKKDILKLYNEFKYLPKNKAIEIVETIYLNSIQNGIRFNLTEMDLISCSIKLLNQNVKTDFILANIFSMILAKQYDNI